MNPPNSYCPIRFINFSYAKALIAMALDENKVIDVPDEAADDDSEIILRKLFKIKP